MTQSQHMQKFSRMSEITQALSFDDVLLIPQYSEIKSRKEVDLSIQITPHIKLSLPIISANMNTVTDVEMCVSLGKLGGIGILPRFDSISNQANRVAKVKSYSVQVGAAIGVKEEFLERAEALINADVDLLVIDVAHGHMSQTISAVKILKTKFPQVDLVAGNVATQEAANDLFSAGADCVKVGIGPGSICTTRIMTGFGVPQITAILESSKSASHHQKTLICDGGIKNSGDIVKALAAGGHAVMLGNLLAGTTESPGEIIEEQGKKFKQYNGSTSIIEKQKLNPNNIEHVEGVVAKVPFKGPLKETISMLTAGIKSGLSYAGALNISELHQKAKFIKISPLGMRESQAHDVIQD